MSDLNERLLIRESRDELFDRHSTPDEILSRLAREETEDLSLNWLDEASPREPTDVLVIRGTFSAFVRREWTEEVELRDAEFDDARFDDPPTGEIPVARFVDQIGAEYRSIDEQEFSACSECGSDPESGCETCGGDGSVACGTCEGTTEKTCSPCEGDGEVECPTCHGDGSVTCETCEGDGDWECETCEGDGTLLKESRCANCNGAGSMRVEETCSECQGKGSVREDGEWTSCHRCSSGLFNGSGTVTVKKACPECNGGGGRRRRVPCSDCGESGRIDCDECTGGTVVCDRCTDGVGTVECRRCEGEGTRPCRRCDRTGVTDCDDCDDGVVVCSNCEGDGETHSLTVRRTSIDPSTIDLDVGSLPHGVEDVEWTDIEPFVGMRTEEDDRTVVTDATEVDVDAVEDRYFRVDSRYVTVRQVTYDYRGQNFRVREVNDELRYTRLPKPETAEESRGLFGRLRDLF